LCWISVISTRSIAVGLQPNGADGGRRQLDVELLRPGADVGIADRIVARHPDSFEWHRLRVLAIERLGQDPVQHLSNSESPAELGWAWLPTDPGHARALFERSLEHGTNRLAAAGLIQEMLTRGTVDDARFNSLLPQLTDSERFYFRAQRALADGNTSKARELAARATRANPVSTLARFALARAELTRNRLASAEEALEEACYLDPVSPDGYELRAELALAMDQVDRARSIADAGRRRYPQRPTILLLMVDVDLAAGHPKKAKSDLLQLRRLAALRPDLWAPRAAQAGGSLRERELLARAIETWPSTEPGRARYAGYLAYLDGDVEGLNGLLTVVEEDDRAELEGFTNVLRRKDQKNERARTFNWILLGLIGTALVGILLSKIRSR